MSFNRQTSLLSLSLFLAAAFSGAVTAQEKIPFQPGEKLSYEGKLSKIISGIDVADLTLAVEKADDDQIVFKADAHSKGTLMSLFKFSFVQSVESVVERDTFSASKTTKRDEQKDRVRESEAVFDYGDKKVIYTEVDPKDPMKPPRVIATDLDGRAHDIISGIYNLRMLPLGVNKHFSMLVSDSGLVFKVPVTVTAREQIKTEIGKFWCFRVVPDIFGPGRLIENEGEMVIWITDEPRRIPVRASVKTKVRGVGLKIDIKIESATFGESEQKRPKRPKTPKAKTT